MLSISNGTAGYYARLAQDDYYNEGKEPPGKWHGRGAELFGLTGQVERQKFYALCSGYDPRINEPLVHHAGSERRRALWDLTFSAPKGVSTWWGTTDDETRNRISDCYERAVRFALDYIEERGDLVGTRAGKSGTELDPDGKLFFSLYEHSTSREQDPQLHIHAVMINLGINTDGNTRTLDPIELMRTKLLIGAISRAEFSRELQKEFGVEVERLPKGMFDICGVPAALKADGSKRRQQILETMKEEDAWQGAEVAAVFAKSTRRKKEYKEREQLSAAWRETAQKFGFDEREVINRREFVPETWERTTASLDKVVKELTTDRAYFTEKDLLHRLAIEAQYTGAGFNECREVAARYLSTTAIHLRTEKGQQIFTTEEIDQLEKKMFAQGLEGRETRFAPLKEVQEWIDAARLKSEQLQALYHIAIEEKGDIKVVSGMAGTGKTTILKTAREVWEASGYQVKGAALAAVAAKNLETESGIKSETIHRFLSTLEHSVKETDAGKKSVWVIDEAGMVGTRQMAQLIDEAKKAGAKLVLVGDERQLQPIEHGAPFKALGELLGRAELKEIQRQHEEWAREAVHNFADGEAEKGLAKYIERGLLVIRDKRDEAQKDLVDAWLADKNSYKDKVIIASTNHQVKALNALAQGAREKAGELGERSLKLNGSEIHIGDRVLFTKNSRKFSVLNGETATVKEVDEEKGVLAVRMDGGGLRLIPTRDYEHVALAYAATTHKLQGNTKQTAYVIVGSTMESRELSYVKTSRHREVAKIFAAVEDVGETYQTMAKLMSRSNQKEMAQEQRIYPEPQYERTQAIQR